MPEMLEGSSLIAPAGFAPQITGRKSDGERLIEAADLLVSYLEAAGIEYVFGVPGGNIEPFYDALLRSERRGGPRPVLARHETGAAFMADGYARNSGRIGVCCATTGPGTTNLITGVASAYENNIPLLVITAQTSLKNFGRRALQESTDTGVNTVGMFQYCTCYNTLVSHVDQLEHKLISAMMTAVNDSRPAHLSIPLDLLRASVPQKRPEYDVPGLLQESYAHDDRSIDALCQQLERAKGVVFVLGAGCNEAIPLILLVVSFLKAQVVTTPDGKGLISPYHPYFKGVIGFGGHKSAQDCLMQSDVDTVVAVGTTLGEWQSNGWDAHTILNGRLIHIEALASNLTRSPMARLHVGGNLVAVFEMLADRLGALRKQVRSDNSAIELDFSKTNNSGCSHLPMIAYDELRRISCEQPTSLIKPQWLMSRLTQLLPPHTKYLADAGNSMTWAIHYLHPFDRRLSERRLVSRTISERPKLDKGRRVQTAGLFQVAAEFASMGWAIAASVGAAMACPRQPTVCITGDGSMLMSGQEITVALEHQLSVMFVVLNDSSLGMVKHGQRMTGAEQGVHQLPCVDFSAMAKAMGVKSIRIRCLRDLIDLETSDLFQKTGPVLVDVVIDGEEVPPIGARVQVLQDTN